jgi:hypothetical protein
MTMLNTWMKANARLVASSAVRRLRGKSLQKTDFCLAALALKA